jgi:hypothetical protein
VISIILQGVTMSQSCQRPILFAIAILTSCGTVRADAPASDGDSWTAEFSIDKSEWTSSGHNQYFILEPGYQLVLANGDEQLTITVLDESKNVAGVETRVVEERETKGGQPVEMSRNYFAMSKRTNSVYYFGEDVDIYKDGKVASHEGGWLAGIGGAKFGLMMPGEILLKARYYQEWAPGQAMDRAEIVATNVPIKTPRGEYDCLKTEETTSLEPDSKEYKYYAPNVGLVQDESLKLIKYGMIGDHCH